MAHNTDIHNNTEVLSNPNITFEKKIELMDFIKSKQAHLRITFIDSIKNIDSDLYLSIKNNLDKLTDMLAENVFNAELDFTDKSVYENNIKNIIIYSRNDLISNIFNYKGTAR